MGFTEPQGNAAIRACGGSGVSSVDDLINWILENGEKINEEEEEEVVVKKVERKESSGSNTGQLPGPPNPQLSPQMGTSPKMTNQMQYQYQKQMQVRLERSDSKSNTETSSSLLCSSPISNISLPYFTPRFVAALPAAADAAAASQWPILSAAPPWTPRLSAGHGPSTA